MEKARAGRTTIMVAHRLSTVRHADKIFVLSAGTVVEEGNHEQLMSINGVYASMLVKQDRQQNDVEDFSSNSLSQASDDIMVLGDNTPELTGRTQSDVGSENEGLIVVQTPSPWATSGQQ